MQHNRSIGISEQTESEYRSFRSVSISIAICWARGDFKAMQVSFPFIQHQWSKLKLFHNTTCRRCTEALFFCTQIQCQHQTLFLKKKERVKTAFLFVSILDSHSLKQAFFLISPLEESYLPCTMWPWKVNSSSKLSFVCSFCMQRKVGREMWLPRQCLAHKIQLVLLWVSEEVSSQAFWMSDSQTPWH